MAKGKRKLKKWVKVALIILLAVIFIVICVIHEINKRKVFVYNEHLEEVVLTIDDTDITLREFAYYVAQSEEIIQEMAYVYDPEDPIKFWHVHFRAGLDSQYTYEYAKSEAVEMCIYCYIMEKEAFAQGLELNPKAKEDCITTATNKMYSLEPKALINTGLSIDTFVREEQRQQVTKAYASVLSQAKQVALEDMDFHGDYYINNIKPYHTIIRYEEVLDQIQLGKMTVNVE